MDKRNKIILWTAIIISVIAFLFWDIIREKTGIPIYYFGNSLAFLLLSVFIWLNFKKYVASFVLLCLSINNFLDETIFDNTKFGLNEAFFALILIIITYLRYARKTTKPIE